MPPNFECSLESIKPGKESVASGNVTLLPVEEVNSLVDCVYPKLVGSFDSAPLSIPSNLLLSPFDISPAFDVVARGRVTSVPVLLVSNRVEAV